MMFSRLKAKQKKRKEGAKTKLDEYASSGAVLRLTRVDALSEIQATVKPQYLSVWQSWLLLILFSKINF